MDLCFFSIHWQFFSSTCDAININEAANMSPWPATFQLLNDGPSLRPPAEGRGVGGPFEGEGGGEYQMKPGPPSLLPVHWDASHMLPT